MTKQEFNTEEELRNRQSRHFSSEDLHQTIAFTEEDLARLRQPNPQPLDSDYFVNSTRVENRILSYKPKEVAQSAVVEDTTAVTELDELEAYNQFDERSAQTRQKKAKRSFKERMIDLMKRETANMEVVEEALLAPVRDEDRVSVVELSTAKVEDSVPLVEDSEQHTDESIEVVTVSETVVEETAIVSNDKSESLAEMPTAEVIAPHISETLVQANRSLKNKRFVLRKAVNESTVEPTPTVLSEVPVVMEQETVDTTVEEPLVELTEKESLGDKASKLWTGLVKRTTTESETEAADTEQYEDLEQTVEVSDWQQKVNTATEKESLGDKASKFWTGLVERITTEEVEDDTDEEDTIEVAHWNEEVAAYGEQLSQETQYFSEPILTDQMLEDILTEDDLTVEQELQEQQSLVKGTAWLTFGNVFSRILGALYIVPWATWLGAEYTKGNGLFSAGYRPYSLFLAIATAGFPSAIAKQMAYYHSRKEYRVADKLFKYSLLIMLVTGLLSGGVLFLMAPVLANMTPTSDPLAATLVIRSLVPALLILPMMSLLRGYFQGFNDMVPTAVSQLIEQVVRVFYMLSATYAIMQVYNGGVTNAVVHSTFAAFIGALGSLLYLVVIYLRRLPRINRLIAQTPSTQTIDFMTSAKIMLVDSIPFILLGSGIIFAQLIDTYTFQPILIMTSALRTGEIEVLYGALSLDVDKLIMIIISLAVAISTSAVPAIAGTFAKRDVVATRLSVQRIIVLFAYVMLPAAVGMAALSTNVYQLFYPAGSEAGPALLITACYMSIVLGLYTVLSSVLQAMNFRRLTIQYLLIGLLVKIVLQFPAMALFQAEGALISTLIAFSVVCVLLWLRIVKELQLDYSVLVPQLAKIMAGTIVMGVCTRLWVRVLDGLFGEVGRGATLAKVIVMVAVGVFVYFAIMGLTGMLSVLFGNRKKDLQDQLQVF